MIKPIASFVKQIAPDNCLSLFESTIISNHKMCYALMPLIGPCSSSGRASVSGLGGRWVDTWPRHTKGVKMVSVATLLGAQHYKASTGFFSPNIIQLLTSMR